MGPAASPAPTPRWRSGCRHRTQQRSCGKLALPVLLLLNGLELSTSPILAGHRSIRLSRPAADAHPLGGSRLNATPFAVTSSCRTDEGKRRAPPTRRVPRTSVSAAPRYAPRLWLNTG